MRIYSNLLIATMLGCVSTAAASAPGERNCGISLNEVPAVTDTTAHRIYFTLPKNQTPQIEGTLSWDNTRIKTVKLNGETLSAGGSNFAVDNWQKRGSYTLNVTDAGGNELTWAVEFTNLPLILIENTQAALWEEWKTDSEKKIPTYITVIDANRRTFESHEDADGVDINSEPVVTFTTTGAVKVRGVTSAGKDKKPFAIELRNEAGEERNMHLLGYRNDGDWILDAMFNDRLRMRNRLLFDLWNSVQDLPYDKDNQYQRNGVDGEFVEIFLKGQYWGLYCFTDKIDRKKLNLKKTQNEGTDSEKLRGLLWKSLFRCSATTFISYSENPRPGKLTWEETETNVTIEQKYPDTRPDQGDFTPIAEMIDCVGEGASDELFAANYRDKFYLSNLTDYHIFTQAFQLQDNLQKNMYLSVRNATKGHTLLITPWDLDASLGRTAGGDANIDGDTWLAFGEQLGGINNLLHRLCYNPRVEDYRKGLYERWEELKAGEWSIQNIKARMLEYADLFTANGAYAREYELWSRKMDADLYNEVDFVEYFLRLNYAAFDRKMAQWGYGTSNPTPDPDDPDAPDGAVVISDLHPMPQGVGYCLRVNMMDGEQVEFMFAAQPEVTFPGSAMAVTSADGSYSWELEDVDYFDFVYVNNPPSSAPMITMPATVSADGAEDAHVYNMQGIEVNPTTLSPGVYVLRVGNTAVKFVKRQ